MRLVQVGALGALCVLIAGCGSVNEGTIDAAPNETDGRAGSIDASGPAVVSIADLRATPDGPTDVILEGVYVTYLSTNAFYLQTELLGPAIAVFTGAAPPTVSPGNRVDLHITQVSSFQGNKQISQFNIEQNDNGTFNVSALAQTLDGSPVVRPSEELEAELVHLNRMSVTADLGSNSYEVTYGGLSAQFFFPNGSVTVGCDLELVRGVVTEFMTVHQIRADAWADVVVLNPAACSGV